LKGWRGGSVFFSMSARISLHHPHDCGVADIEVLGDLSQAFAFDGSPFDHFNRQRPHRRLHDRQRPVHERPARRRDDAVPQYLDGVITSWNHGAGRLFGYAAEEMIGKPITILIPTERLDEEKTILARIRCGERIECYETSRRRKDGSIVDISLTVSPVRNRDGKIHRRVKDRPRHHRAQAGGGTAATAAQRDGPPRQESVCRVWWCGSSECTHRNHAAITLFGGARPIGGAGGGTRTHACSERTTDASEATPTRPPTGREEGQAISSIAAIVVRSHQVNHSGLREQRRPGSTSALGPMFQWAFVRENSLSVVAASKETPRWMYGCLPSAALPPPPAPPI
jgi:PAS domain S-box-containing protein